MLRDWFLKALVVVAVCGETGQATRSVERHCYRDGLLRA